MGWRVDAIPVLQVRKRALENVAHKITQVLPELGFELGLLGSSGTGLSFLPRGAYLLTLGQEGASRLGPSC